MSGDSTDLLPWSEVVTTALLGTSRRPLPPSGGDAGGSRGGSAQNDDPAARVLQLAARHRAAALVGTPPRQLPAPPATAAAWLVPAPAAAQQVLVSLLARPEPVLVNLWLTECADRGLGVISDLWPRLGSLASRQTAYDRELVRRVLGERGRWFLRQHPQWVRVATEPDPVPDSDDEPDAEPADARREADVATAPIEVAGAETPPLALQRILASPDPWPPELARVALHLVLGGGLGQGTREAATSVAARLPLTLAPQLTAARADRTARTGPPPQSLVRGAEQVLAIIERIMQARVEIHAGFAEHQPVPGPSPAPVRTHS